jgi:tetratricopeptide (TPR) repeat protein
MWRRVASQSPDQMGGATDGVMAYKLAYAAMSELLFSGKSLSGRERNSLFLNVGNRRDGMPGKFANVSFLSGFGVNDDTRGVAMVDWDQDGDLDVWLTNRTAPRLRLLRNDLPKAGASSLQVRLEGMTCNRDAIGARLELTLPSGRRLYQTRRCGEGFLTQNSAWIHFGLGAETVGSMVLTVHWPDGKTENFAKLTANKRWHVRQGAGKPTEAAPVSQPALASSGVTVEPWSGASRTALVARVLMPKVTGAIIQKQPKSAATKRGKLYLFAASWCQPCAVELAELAKAASTLRKQGIEVEVLAVPAEGVTAEEESKAMSKLLKKVKAPFGARVIDATQAGALDVFHRSFLSMRRPLPLPSSFLADAQDRLAFIYRGAITTTQIITDVPALAKSPERVRQEDLPFQGQWIRDLPPSDLINALIAWKREGYLAYGQRYLRDQLDRETNLPPKRRSVPTSRLTLWCEHLVDFSRLQNDEVGVVDAYQRALVFDPNYLSALSGLGSHYGRAGKITEAVPYFERAAKLAPNDSRALQALGVARVKQNKLTEARDLLLQSVRLNPRDLAIRIDLLKVRISLKEWQLARTEGMQLWRAAPGNQAVGALLPKILPNLSKADQAKLKQDVEAVMRQARQR